MRNPISQRNFQFRILSRLFRMRSQIIPRGRIAESVPVSFPTYVDVTDLMFPALPDKPTASNVEFPNDLVAESTKTIRLGIDPTNMSHHHIDDRLGLKPRARAPLSNSSGQSGR